MFDWNDEELANIIWDERGENDDHIVPFPEASEDLSYKKELNREGASSNLTELRKREAKTDLHEKLGSSSNLDNSGGLLASGYGANSWHDLSLSSEAKIDQGSLGTEGSKNLGELSKFSSSREETIQHEKDADFFQNAHEGKEQCDFVDYGWANIGSFDDLDRIFSNDDSIFGHVSLDNSDELWSSKDVSNYQAPKPLDARSPSSALRNRSEPLEIKDENVQCNDQSFSFSYEKIGDPSSQVIHNSTTANVECAGVRSKPTGKEQQAFRQKNQFKRKKSQIKQEGENLHDFYGDWSSSATSDRQFQNQLAPSVLQSSPSSSVGQPKRLQGPETLYLNPYAASSVYGNFTNTCPTMPMISQVQSGNVAHQSVLSAYEMVNPLKNSLHLVKPQTMTPQEKIEKLRRRQQMQALLAIQKKQQELGQQVPSPSKSHCHLSDGTDHDIEDLRTLPAVDIPIEQDDSNTISLAIDNNSVEEAILYRLQDIISKLDINTRLCIRDSLFRLARSAMQRQHISDTRSAKKGGKEENEVVAREESNSQNRYETIPDVETETNPIDRTMAHLLFHRPLELTGTYSNKIESSISSKVKCESKSANNVNFPVGCLPEEDLKSNQQFSHVGLNNSCQLFEAHPSDQIKNSPCIGTSVNASNTHEPETSK